MKRLKQIISALLCVVMVFGTSVVANAQDNINFDNISFLDCSKSKLSLFLAFFILKTHWILTKF